jgi:membrane-bound lytic murein transglycosylase F
MKKILRVSTGFLAAVIMTIFVNGCDGWMFEKAAFGHSSEQKPLKLLVVQNPLTYQRLSEFEKGFEYELLQHFALDNGYRLQVKVMKSEKALIKELEAGRGDIGAARFRESLVHNSKLPRSPIYDEEKTSLVCHEDSQMSFNSRGQLDPKSQWKLVINPNRVEDSWIQLFKKEAPRLKVSRKQKFSSFAILKSLAPGKQDCTLLDRMEANFYLKVFPELKIVKDVSPAFSYFFLLGKDDSELGHHLRYWLTKASRRHLISQKKAKAQSKHPALSDSDVRRFLADRERLLPLYFSLFKKHGQSFGVPWQVAAAVAYQESRWNPEAESFTGVRGFMQLTQETAEHLGVDDRLDPNQSIWGGVKYIKMLLDRQPKGLPFTERLALALATYNVGPAHMLDAQKLAQRLGKNPYAWKDLKEVLPLLADQDYLPFLKYGPARGQEPVDYVQRVFGFLDLMTVQI